MFLDDIVSPLNELSKDQLKNYIKANAEDQVQHASSQSFKSGQAGDTHNKADAWDKKTKNREKGLVRALDKLAKDADQDDELAEDGTNWRAHRVPELNRTIPGMSTAAQATTQFTNLKQNQKYMKPLTPSPLGHLQVSVNGRFFEKGDGGVVIKGNTVDTSHRRNFGKPFTIDVDANGQIINKDLRRLHDDELEAVEYNLAVRNKHNFKLVPGQIAGQIHENKKEKEQDLVKQHAKDQEYVRNDPILHYGGNIAGVKGALKQAKKKHPTAKNDVEAMFAEIGDQADLNQSQEQLLQKHKRVINQITQQLSKVDAENQQQTDIIAKLSNMLQQTPAAPSQQVAHQQQAVREESKPRLTRIHYFTVDQPTVAQEIGLKQDRGGNWCLYQFDTSGAGFDRKFTQAVKIFGRPAHSQSVNEGTDEYQGPHGAVDVDRSQSGRTVVKRQSKTYQNAGWGNPPTNRVTGAGDAKLDQIERELNIDEDNYSELNYRKDPKDKFAVFDHTFNKIILTTNSSKEAKKEAVEWAEYDDITVSVKLQATGKILLTVDGAAGAMEHMDEDAFHSEEVGNSWSAGTGQWTSGDNQISSANNPQGFSEDNGAAEGPKTYGVAGCKVVWDGEYFYVYKNDKMIYRNPNPRKWTEKTVLKAADLAIDHLHDTSISYYKSAPGQGVKPAYSLLQRTIKHRTDKGMDISPAVIASDVDRIAKDHGITTKELRAKWKQVNPYKLRNSPELAAAYEKFSNEFRSNNDKYRKIRMAGGYSKWIQDKMTDYISHNMSEDEGDVEGLPHLTKELLSHIVQQVGTEGAHAIVKSLEWGDGAAEELLTLILRDLKQDISDEEIAECIASMQPQGVAEDTGSWIVYDPETKQIKKRFKTHTAGKSYAQAHKLGFASSEYYFDRVKEKEVAEASPSVNIRSLAADVSSTFSRESQRFSGQPTAQLLAPVLQKYGVTMQQLETLLPQGLKRAAAEFGVQLKEDQQSFQNGDQVELKPEYADKPGEVYTVSQLDTERGRCWIGDKDGRGWYARFDQLIPAKTMGNDDYDREETIKEGRVKELAYDLNQLNDLDFREKYGSTKQRWQKQLGRRPMSDKLAQSPHIQKMNAVYGKPYSNLKDIEDDLPESTMKDLYADNQDAVYSALTRRVIGTLAGRFLIATYGLDKVMDAMREVADFHGDVEEIGSSDVSAYMRQLQRTLENNQ